jgi:hypothetical protein
MYYSNPKIYCKKNAPVEVEGNLMFSQRNNPYCDLLQENKIMNTFHSTKFFNPQFQCGQHVNL